MLLYIGESLRYPPKPCRGPVVRSSRALDLVQYEARAAPPRMCPHFPAKLRTRPDAFEKQNYLSIVFFSYFLKYGIVVNFANKG